MSSALASLRGPVFCAREVPAYVPLGFINCFRWRNELPKVIQTLGQEIAMPSFWDYQHSALRQFLSLRCWAHGAEYLAQLQHRLNC